MPEYPSFRPFIFPTLLLVFGGWGGVAALLIFAEPLIWMRWSLFALLFLAMTGTALPLVYIFHLRFPGDPPPGLRVILRQAQWVGVYGLVLLWLRQGDLLTTWLALILAGGLLTIEWLIRLRERSLWKPPVANNTAPISGDDNPA
jgi:hypothetical protein